MSNLEFYVAREWNGWLCGIQMIFVLSAAQEKFGSDDKDNKNFARKHIVNDVAGQISDLRKLKLTDDEIIAVLENEKNKQVAKIMRG